VSTFTAPSWPLPKPLYHPSTSPTTSSVPSPSELAPYLKVDAIFILNDPRDWALDTQILTDLLLSHGGCLGTYSAHNGAATLPNRGWQRDGQPRLYFSNADLLWSAAHPLPRLGQGAFQAALAGLWRRVTAGAAELERTCIGKPFGGTYRFAERVLARHRSEVLRRLVAGTAAAGAATTTTTTTGRRREGGEGEGKEGEAAGGGDGLKTVYMVGDNPESDIAGANGHVSEDGAEWVSVLVKTGVWREGRGAKLGGEFKPRAVVDDVKAAVEWALRREGWRQGDWEGTKLS
jgi:ribonucleotide monophosphatase NagD (HAD superfamily)